MSAYIGYTPMVSVDSTNQLSDQIISIVSGQTVYTLNFAPTSDNLLMINVNGETYVPTLDFSITTNQLTILKAGFPSSGYIYVFYLGTNYFRINSVSDGAIQHTHLSSELKTFDYRLLTGDGAQTVWTLDFTPGSPYALFITVNGNLLKPLTDYTLIASTLTFIAPPALNAEIIIRNLGFKTSSIDYQIPTEGVTSDKIAPLAVTSAKIANNAVIEGKIADTSIAFEKLKSTLVSDVFFYEKINSNTTVPSTKSKKYLVDTAANSVAITLPATPTLGQYVDVIDCEESFDEYSCSILRNGNTIDGLAENSLLYKRGVHCIFIWKGTDWMTLFLDPGIEFTGVQYPVDTWIEAFNTLAERHESNLVKMNNVYVTSITTSSGSLTEGQTLNITFTSNNSVTVTGSGTTAKLVILLSDNVTTVDATYNSGLSTSSTLVFSYTVGAGVTSSGIKIQSFNTGTQTVTINGKSFKATNIPLAVNFV